jgi:hypothetical protein
MSLSPDSPISLQEAAEICLRGLVKVATLRVAVERGELMVERLGRRVITTPAAVDEWRSRCRVKPKAQDSTSCQNEGRETDGYGSSEMDRRKLAQAAALATARALKNGSLTISQPNMSPSAEIVRLQK